MSFNELVEQILTNNAIATAVASGIIYALFACGTRQWCWVAAR